MVEAVSRRLWLRLGKRCVRREDRHMLRLRLRRMQMVAVTPTPAVTTVAMVAPMTVTRVPAT